MDTKKETDDSKSESTRADDELNNILDNALDDFDKVKDVKEETDAADMNSMLKEVWNEDLLKEAFSQFEECMKNFCPGEDTEESLENFDQLCEDFKKMADITGKTILEESTTTETEENTKEIASELSKDFSKIAEEACKIINSDTSLGKDFQSTISRTLENLKENLSGVKNEQNNDFLAMLNGMADSEGSDNQDSVFASLCNKILQTFLSKDVLYEPLSEVHSKFPKWLDENKPELSSQDLTRYQAQFEVLTKICEEYKATAETEDDHQKTKNFQNILQLLLELQAYGNLPESLVTESVVSFEDSKVTDFMTGLSSATGSSQCGVM